MKVTEGWYTIRLTLASLVKMLFLAIRDVSTDLQPDIPGWACGRLKVKKKF